MLRPHFTCGSACICRLGEPKTFSVASSFASAQTGKLSCKLQGQGSGSGSFQRSECGLPSEGPTSLRLFSATAGTACMHGYPNRQSTMPGSLHSFTRHACCHGHLLLADIDSFFCNSRCAAHSTVLQAGIWLGPCTSRSALFFT